MADRIPITVVVEGERLVLGTMEVVLQTKVQKLIDITQVIVDLGTRQFRGEIVGKPWNVFVLKEEI